jgi:HSP20 family protein
MTTLTRFTPAHDILTIRDLMERMFDETLAPANYSANVEGRLTVDAYTTQNEIVVQAALPGVKPEDVEITVENDTLKISAELPKRLEDVDYAFVERPHGRFSRTLMLNVPVEADKANAHFENGLLTLTLPKAETVKPKMIKVKAK